MTPQISRKILIIGPSRAGKTFYANAWKAQGLPVVDADADTALMAWYNDATGAKWDRKPRDADEVWFSHNHFKIMPDDLRQYLSGQGGLLFLANCWNIMEVAEQFDTAFLLYFRPSELAKRLKVVRPDHQPDVSAAEIAFVVSRHRARHQEARKLGIPLLDATLPPERLLERVAPCLTKSP